MKKLFDRYCSLISVFILIFSLSLIFVVGVCISKPQHNLIPGRMVAYTAFWFFFLVIARWILVWLEKRLGVHCKIVSGWAFGILMVLYGVFLFVLGSVARIHPHTDYMNVYNAAAMIADGARPDNWAYFSRCTNNRFVMVLLAGGLRLGGFYFVLAVQVLHVLCVLCCVFYLGFQVGTEKRYANAWTMVLIYGLMTPIWGNIGIFYTDQMSFGYGAIAFTLFYIACYRLRSGKMAYFLTALAGILWGVGSSIKITIAISLIAQIILWFLGRRVGKEQVRKWRYCFVLLVFFAVTFAVINAGLKLLPCEENVKRDSSPVLYWVALGLGGDGSYAENEEFAQECLVAENLEQRKAIVNRKLASDWKNFFDREHIVRKIRKNFACGDLGANGYMTYPYHENNIVYQFMSYEGRFFWKYACVSTSYLFAVFLLIAVGGLGEVLQGRRTEEVFVMSYITIFGIMLFLMLWEAQNKQLYNHTGWLVLAAGNGLQKIEGVLHKWKK